MPCARSSAFSGRAVWRCASASCPVEHRHHADAQGVQRRLPQVGLHLCVMTHATLMEQLDLRDRHRASA